MEDDERKNVVASGIGTLQWGEYRWLLQNFWEKYKTHTYYYTDFTITWFFTDKSKPYSSLQMPHVSLHNFQRPKTSLDQQPLISSWFSKTFPPLNFYFDILFCPLVLKVPSGFPGVLKTNVICCFVKTPNVCF